ncbi:hypothetical protein FZZ93_00285 [Halomonas eurihalina]|uniref:Uncharacterized protein n=1 Tax=Halomonas eurihalina TaxID=42566 RepID=A0A5D9DBF5_HALER|nr:hypothetical protein [Halomonas eurihalina]MDR5858372.1 hypothetical protein [Halomonas eurihalina]TZG41136.1 hypothetical protein FZZ93_00285 [Halomonas eurihalina]
MSDYNAKIERLQRFAELVREWEASHSEQARTEINKLKRSVQRDVMEAGCLKTMTISPPPAVGGLIMRNVNPFEHIFQDIYLRSLNPVVLDMIAETIGVLEEERDNPLPDEPEGEPEISYEVQVGYVFVAMPIGTGSPYDDVLDSIKEACSRCGLSAERVDEVQSNERITDRILESIQKAQFVVADLTEARPNVFYEAGYAHGIGKLPIYIARAGTKLEFDLQDYPVIFFDSYRELKQGLEDRLRAFSDS